MNEWMNNQICKRKIEWIYEWINKWTNESMNEWNE